MQTKLSTSWLLLVLGSVSLGLMLSPENLVLVGRGAGAAGSSVYLWLAIAAGVHFVVASSFSQRFKAALAGEAGIWQDPTWMRLMSVVLPVAGRFGMALWGATAVLVTAGYVFNETFWPAYPNLGFSFTLLGILVTVNLLFSRGAALVQTVFVLAALAGLLTLIIAGLLGLPQVAPKAGVNWPVSLPRLSLILGFSLAFLGYELAGFLWKRIGTPTLRPGIPMLAGIAAAFCLFSLWSFVSLKYVPAIKLQESTIPYAYVVQGIAGETGHLIMGAVLLAGAVAAANALLLAVPLMAADLTAGGLLPAFFTGRITLILLGCGIALVMALGLGGSPNLPVFLKASALFWLLAYAWQLLKSWRDDREGPAVAGLRPAALASALVLISIVILAVITEPERTVLGVYLIVVSGALAGVSIIHHLAVKKISPGGIQHHR